MARTLFILIFLMLLFLAGCEAFDMRYSPEWVRGRQVEYRGSAPVRCEYVPLPLPTDEAALKKALFVYDPVENPFPKRIPGKGKSFAQPLLKSNAVAAISAAFLDAGVPLEHGGSYKTEGVEIPLHGWNRELKMGFLFITNEEMPVGLFGKTPRGSSFIDKDEVYALADSGALILLISDEDERFRFPAGLDPAGDPLELNEILANRDKALCSLYRAARMWAQKNKP